MIGSNSFTSLRLRHLLWLLLFGACAPEGLPDPYDPGPEGAPECELSADCPAGTYCDLGQCYQECNSDDPCSDGSCTSRGECSIDGDTDSDPLDVAIPPESTVGISVDPVDVAEGQTSAVLHIEADDPDAVIRYRVDSRVAWLRAPEPRGELSGSADVALEVVADGLQAGIHDGFIVVHTTAGNDIATARLAVGIEGIYQGVMTYTDPRPLGSAPLRIEVLEVGGNPIVRVDPLRSSLFPALAEAPAPVIEGSRPDDAILGAIQQRFAPGDWSASIIDRDIGRRFTFELTPSVSGGLQGSFEETWVGLFPDSITISGTIELSRRPGDPTFDPTLIPDAVLPPDPTAYQPGLSATCSSVAQQLSQMTIGSCTDASDEVELFNCGNAARDAGARLESDEGGLLISDPARGYLYFTDACAIDLAADDPTPAVDPASCVRPGNLSCAVALYGRAAAAGLDEGALGIGYVVSDYAGVGLLLINDAIVLGFQAPYASSALDDMTVEAEMVTDLENGRAAARDVLRRIFDPYLLDELRQLPGFLASQDAYRPLRRTAQLLSRYRLASDELMRLKLRSLAGDPDELREQLGRDALQLIMVLASLSVIEAEQAAPASPELGLFAEAITEVGRSYLELEDTTDPLGVPDGFVEFLYDPNMPGAGATNFQQVLSAHVAELNKASTDEAEAEQAIREFDTVSEQLINELETVHRQQRQQLVQICGPLPGDPARPNVDNCGEISGDLAVARNQVLEEMLNVKIASQRIEDLGARVAIQKQRLQEVHDIRQDSIAFLTETNERLDALDAKDTELATAQTAISAGAGIVSAVLNAKDNPAAAVESVAGAANSAIGLMREKIAKQKESLYRAQQLRAAEDDAEVEYINGMATIKEMLVGMAELNLQLQLAQLRMATSALRYAQLQESVASINAETVLQEQRLTDPDRLINDPTFRVLADRAVARALVSREVARRGIYLSAKAFEFETNSSFPAIESHVVPSHRTETLVDFVACLESNFNNFRSVYGVPQTFVDELSLREDVLGITAAVEDPVTGDVISEAEQFRRRLLTPSNIGGDGAVALRFTTSLSPGNGAFSAGVCNDQIRTLQVKLVGDGLGDNQARVRLRQEGASLMRSCSAFRSGRGDVIHEYNLMPRTVEVQAGINTYPDAPPDSQLFGRAVASTEWLLVIPSAVETGVNADIDLLKIEDIVVRLEHSAISLSDAPLEYTPTCGF